MKKSAQKDLALSAADYHAGDRVQVIDREATPDETKKRIFFNHMRGLTGIVRRAYEEEGEVWVEVNQDSLPEDVLQRHRETEKQMKQKWMDSLSDEARRKLGAAESQFSLRYSILTSPNHLILLEEGDPSDAPAPEPTALPETTRKTSQELTAAELEFLERAMAKGETE